MEENPYVARDLAGDRPRKSSVPGLVLKILLGLGVVILLVALLLPAVRTGREAARRNSCSNHLRQIAVALLMYAEKEGAFPPAYTTDADGNPLHSWRTLILPYLEHVDLYEQLDLTRPWDDPVNAKVFQAHAIDEYHCPAAEFPQDHTNYLAVVTPHSCLRPGEPRNLADITDRHSKTMIVTEVDVEHSVPWMAPRDADENLAVHIGPNSKLAHLSLTGVVFADGHVSYLDTDVTATQRRALISISGNDNDVLDAWD